jgi:hypothetical protein
VAASVIPKGSGRGGIPDPLSLLFLAVPMNRDPCKGLGRSIRGQTCSLFEKKKALGPTHSVNALRFRETGVLGPLRHAPNGRPQRKAVSRLRLLRPLPFRPAWQA